MGAAIGFADALDVAGDCVVSVPADGVAAAPAHFGWCEAHAVAVDVVSA